MQYPEKNVRISFAEESAAKVFTLDYLGDVRQLGAEREGGRLSCVLPQLDKGAVVWTE